MTYNWSLKVQPVPELAVIPSAPESVATFGISSLRQAEDDGRDGHLCLYDDIPIRKR